MSNLDTALSSGFENGWTKVMGFLAACLIVVDERKLGKSESYKSIRDEETAKLLGNATAMSIGVAIGALLISACAGSRDSVNTSIIDGSLKMLEVFGKETDEIFGKRARKIIKRLHEEKD